MSQFRRVWVVGLLVGLLAVGGCASRLTIPDLPSVEAVEMTEAKVKAATGNSIELLTKLAEVVNAVGKIEHEAATVGAIPANIDKQFDRVIVEYGAYSTNAVRVLKTGAVQTWPEMRALLEPVRAKGQMVIDIVNSIGVVKTKAQELLGRLTNLLGELIGQFLVKEHNFGGAR